jgi:hypothetical protein
VFLPDDPASDDLFASLAVTLGKALTVFAATCEEEGAASIIEFQGDEITATGTCEPLDLDVEPEDLDASTSGPPSERVDQVLRALIGFEDGRSDVAHDLFVFVPDDAPDGGRAADEPLPDRGDLEELIEQADSARKVVIARTGDDSYRVTFIDVLVKLRANRPPIPLGRSRANLNSSDTAVLREHLEKIGGRKLAIPSVRPLDLEEQLFEIEEENLDFEDDSDLDESGEAFALDMLTGSSQLKSLLREFLPRSEEPVASVSVHPDAIVVSLADARKLLEILVKQSFLELDDPDSLPGLIAGVFELGAKGDDAETLAGELSEWLLDQPCVEELYIDDEKLAELLRVW